MIINKQEDQEWLEYPAKFIKHYDTLNYKGLGGYFMEKSHEIAEREFGSDRFFNKVLEVGAGSGHHLKHIKHGFAEYIISDTKENLLIKAIEQITSRGANQNTKYLVEDCAELSFEDNLFDRLIATHVLEHMYSPHLVLKEWYRVVKKGGIMTIVLPTDPGVIWRVVRQFSRKRAQRLGFAYDYLMAREHVNPINNLISLIHYYFKERKELWYPFRVPSIDINFYYCCHIYKNS
jgi:phosphatidylethanolamine/phosphatidyl-N-methylethanolamine N-methyltransferase